MDQQPSVPAAQQAPAPTTKPKMTYIRKALTRTRERALAYMRILAVGVGALIVVNGLALGASLVISLATSNLPSGPKTLITIIQILLALPLFLFDIYLALWMQLSLAQAVIQPIQEHYRTTIMSARPVVRDYFNFYFKFMLFGLFLIPLDVVTARFLFIPIVSILWTVWGLFATFVFLEKRKKGLANLWTARSIYNQRFVGFTWRLLLTYVGVVIGVTIILAPLLVVSQIGGDAAFPVLIGAAILFVLMQLLLTVFFMSYEYELYASVAEPPVVRRPKEWIWLGLAGIVLAIVLTIAFPQEAAKEIGTYTNRGDKSTSNSPDSKYEFATLEAPAVIDASNALGFNYRLEEQNDVVECNRESSAYVCKKRVLTIYGLPGNLDVEVANVYDRMVQLGWQLSDRDTNAYYDRTSAWQHIILAYDQDQVLEGERLVFEKDGMYADVAFGSGRMARRLVSPAIYVTCIDDAICKLIKKHANKYQTFLLVDIYKEGSDPPLPTPTRRPTVTPTPFVPPSPSPISLPTALPTEPQSSPSAPIQN